MNPLRHVSVRIPWHDAGWTGVVCTKPHLNGACAKLKRIAGKKRDDLEQAIAGRGLDELPRDQWPPCVEERATFMAPVELEHLKIHALAEDNPKHYGHFQPTPQRYAPYSAGLVPFRWLMRSRLQELGELYALDVDLGREPDLGYESNWVHEADNQKALLDGFAAHLRTRESLSIFYAKHAPFTEGTGRIVVAVGRILAKADLIEYDRSGDGMRGFVWERPIQHSIRPGGTDGFVMPYHEVWKRVQEDPSLDMERYLARAPAEHWDAFSYGSELVTHDGAIAALLALDTALGRIETELGIVTDWQRAWIHDELVRLWQVRGPFPGLGAVLRAFGLSRGVFIAHAIQEKAGANQDPWPLVDNAFGDPASLPMELRADLKALAKAWKGLPPERRTYLRLLSRFELTVDQAEGLYDQASRTKREWSCSDADIIADPYRIASATRHDPAKVHLLTVDRGVFPDDTVRLAHPLEEPSRLESALDARRIGAFALYVLEAAAQGGHTLVSLGDVAQAIREAAVRPACPATADILQAYAPDMAPEISVPSTVGVASLQLGRYRSIRELVHKLILGRVRGQRHAVSRDWAKLLEQRFGAVGGDEIERLARTEKARALAELAESRFSVLAGPAGAGKTSVLGILCTQPEVRAKGLLMLAPTGKARVRMQQLAGDAGAQSRTIAQFLNQHGRYDGRIGRYYLNNRPKADAIGTVIIDEASMLTEDMLGALLDALQGVERLILVGDPSQLPPIGAGRPFVDLVAHLRPDDHERLFPRIAPGYAELTIERRQVGNDRPDLRLARWFSSSTPAPGEDDIFTDDAAHSTIRFVPWEKADDVQSTLLSVLAEELKLANPQDQRGFNRSLGANAQGEYDYFNATRGDAAGAVQHIEDWQILSPLRGMPYGVGDINRFIHERFRADLVRLAGQQRYRKIPKALGPERIVLGDKIINLSNHRRTSYPKGQGIDYLANGEVGIITGKWRRQGEGPPTSIEIEFSSQIGSRYYFAGDDFSEEGEPALELAYALTVHKAQGSQFGLVVLVLPAAHPILSRELIYTALTRHQNRVVILHQGPRPQLKDLAAPHRSETARRRTNLLADPAMVEILQPKGSVFLRDGLIHRTSDGRAVRSKSELLIAEAMLSAGVRFTYERPLVLGGKTRYPDFTIEDEVSGRTVYWEHVGMLDRPDYRAGWERKLAWYQANGVHLSGEPQAGSSVLVTTTESPQSGLDMGRVQALIREVCGG